MRPAPSSTMQRSTASRRRAATIQEGRMSYLRLTNWKDQCQSMCSRLTRLMSLTLYLVSAYFMTCLAQNHSYKLIIYITQLSSISFHIVYSIQMNIYPNYNITIIALQQLINLSTQIIIPSSLLLVSTLVLYFHTEILFFSLTCIIRMDALQNGTMKTKAGWACLNSNMARQVVIRLRVQASIVELNRGNVNYYSLVGLFYLKIQLSMSYLRHNDKSIPGNTTSPSPSMLNCHESASSPKQGNLSLKGKFIFLATVTITSDQQTQYRSQKNKTQSMGSAITNLLRLACLIANIQSAIAQRLSMSQYLVTTSSKDTRINSIGAMPYLRMKRMVLYLAVLNAQ